MYSFVNCATLCKSPVLRQIDFTDVGCIIVNLNKIKVEDYKIYVQVVYSTVGRSR